MSNLEQEKDAAVQQVRCIECLAKVQVRKSAWEQTSVQWNDEALDLCRERPARSTGNLPRDQFVGCETLRAAVRDETVQGNLKLADQVAIS
ncbi:hypothetical protein SLW73_17315 [Glutamicibacter protophormiae]|uniref:hypothetical protein n=1 Tax=Glutamicibacter protophormiae TaxID=37930 RepID=UPI002A810394|nr:hypothetical protein [Glutamicibacter protophormiae]WPR64625.1 hypothetical protein SLW72_17315 [Glutamicibacter protophormiae]WPR68121.1 hypothetical protein SLW73_17315 [Glutamicibacter protophormiae]